MTGEEKKESNFIRLLNESLKIFFKDALRVSLKNPSQAYFFYKTIRWQTKAARQRINLEQQGVHVPPIMIFSITNRCNLQCKGCYAQTLRPSINEEMSEEKLGDIVTEAKDLGISFIVVAGGEPFLRQEILDITKDFPEIIFLVFTNGLLMNDGLLMKLKKQKNVIPLISLEGCEEETDEYRGKGVYARLKRVITRTRRGNIFFGTSLTMTRSNYATLTDYEFIKNLVDAGCKFFIFIEYTPTKQGTDDWVITHEQRARIMDLMRSFRRKFSALFIAVPGDEEEIGGCLSAGRGFIHISADGNVEPCPFVPYSDTNLNDSSLKDALKSDFLQTIRQHHGQLHETEGGCALWARRTWVQSLLNRKR